jgi:hypothetical protein
VRSSILATVVVLGALLTGCSGGSAGPFPDLLTSGAGTHPPHDGALAVGYDSAPRHMSMAIDSTVCGLVDVRVDRVALDHPSSNIHLVRWGIENTLTTYHEGEGNVSLSELGTYVGRSVTRRCWDHFAWSTIGIEIARDDRRSTFEGIDVYYRAFEQPRKLFVPFGVALCSTGTTNDSCLRG